MTLRAFGITLLIGVLGCGGGSTEKPASAPARAGAGVVRRSPKAAPRADASLLSRRLVFGNPERLSPQVSPDGKRLAWLAPQNGVMNVFVAPLNAIAKAKAVSDERTRPIETFVWAKTSQHILYTIDKNGDENTHVLVVDVGAAKTRDLTSFESVQARLVALSDQFPTTAIVALNRRDAEYHDLYHADLLNGRLTILLRNESYADFTIDDGLRVRFAKKPRQGGGFDILSVEGKEKPSVVHSISPEDSLTTAILGFDRAGSTFYMRDSQQRDTSALYAVDTKTNQAKLLAEDPRSDVEAVLVHPGDGHVQAVAFDYERRTWKVLDPAVEPDFAYLKGVVVNGDLEILSRSADDKVWTVGYVSDGPTRYYVYDRAKKQTRPLFSNRPALEKAKLAKMYPVQVPARDKKILVSYLSLPPDSDAGGKPSKPLPLVLSVRSEPWSRDRWSLDDTHQWLASRGYAVLSVNFRGSIGFGKAFANAGDREWAAKMHDDLLDAVDWATKGRIADPERVAIMGKSYGGYASLVGLTFTPDVFACAVDIVGPSNLITVLKSGPAYWAPHMEQIATRIGDPRTEEGKELLASRSPLGRIEQIQSPLLVGHGANDARVKKAESDQLVSAMKAKNLPVSYVLFPDEGHAFVRPENRIAFHAVAEAFLAQHLGGVYQPVGSDFDGASIMVPEGAAHITGLSEALKRRSGPPAPGGAKSSDARK